MKRVLKICSGIIALIITSFLICGCSGVIDATISFDISFDFQDNSSYDIIETSHDTISTNDSFENSAEASETSREEPIVSVDNSASDDFSSEDDIELQIDENGSYTTKEDVALYIHTYGKLPSNFITKSQARALGWEGGGLDGFAPGKCIGGDRFGNYEELLPEKNGRFYTECDIDTLGKSSRGAKRIVFSNDGLVYYTDDHYESFTLLYGEER